MVTLIISLSMLMTLTMTFNLLKSSSFKVIEEQPVFLPFWSNGCKYFNILGPDGERLEFNQIL